MWFTIAFLSLIVTLGVEVKSSKSYSHDCVKSGESGIYPISVRSYSDEPFQVYCDAKTQGGGWIVILRRVDGSVNFDRNWKTYKNGFGDLDHEFFLGLDKIHAITKETSQELLIVLEDFGGTEKYESYDRFGIDAEDEQYNLQTLGMPSGTAGDSFSYHRGQNFSTLDRKHNSYTSTDCAVSHTGGWWYKGCLTSHLTGRYNDTTCNYGVTWDAFKGCRYSLKRAEMMIRPRKLL